MSYNKVGSEYFMDFLIDSLAEFSDEDLDQMNDVDFEFFHEVMQDSSSDVIVSTKSKEKSFLPKDTSTPTPALHYIENNSSTDGSNKEVSTASSDVSFSSESQHSSLSLIPKFFFSDEEPITKTTSDQDERTDDILKKKLDLSANRLRFLARWTEMSRRQVMQLERNLLSDCETCSIFSNLEHESLEGGCQDYNNVALDARAFDKDDRNKQDQDKSPITCSTTEHIVQGKEDDALHNEVPSDENKVGNEDKYALKKSSTTEKELQDEETLMLVPSPKSENNVANNNKTIVQPFPDSKTVVDDGLQNQPRIAISNIECVSQRTRAHISFRNDYKFDLTNVTTNSTNFMDDITALNKLQSSMEKTQLSRFMFAQAIREEKLRRLAMNSHTSHHSLLIVDKMSNISDLKRKNLDAELEISSKRIRHIGNRNTSYGAFMA